MSNHQPYERFTCAFGRYEVFLRGSSNDTDVILRTDQAERNMTPQEALALLSWLYAHKRDLYEIVRRNEQNGEDNQ